MNITEFKKAFLVEATKGGHEVFDKEVFEALIDEESIEDKYKAIEDALKMNENMLLYGTIDAPTTLQGLAVARYVNNAIKNGDKVSPDTMRLFDQMARCVVNEADKLIAKGETISQEKIAELCQEVWLEFNQD